MTIKVLVVDDERDVRDLLVDTLQNARYAIVEIDSAVGIEEIVERERPDVILLDITMPDIDGFEALRKLKSNPLTSDVPVVMASAQSRNDVMLEARQLGAIDFLIKPWKEGEVEWRVENAVNQMMQNAA